MDLLGDHRATRLLKEQKQVAGPPKTSQNIERRKGPPKREPGLIKAGNGHWLSH